MHTIYKQGVGASDPGSCIYLTDRNVDQSAVKTRVELEWGLVSGTPVGTNHPNHLNNPNNPNHPNHPNHLNNLFRSRQRRPLSVESGVNMCL